MFTKHILLLWMACIFNESVWKSEIQIGLLVHLQSESFSSNQNEMHVVCLHSYYRWGFLLDNSHSFSSIADHWSGEAPSRWHICRSYRSGIRFRGKWEILQICFIVFAGQISVTKPVNIWAILVLWVRFILRQRNCHKNVSTQSPWQRRVPRQINCCGKFSRSFACFCEHHVSFFSTAYWMHDKWVHQNYDRTTCTQTPSKHLVSLH